MSMQPDLSQSGPDVWLEHADLRRFAAQQRRSLESADSLWNLLTDKFPAFFEQRINEPLLEIRETLAGKQISRSSLKAMKQSRYVREGCIEGLGPVRYSLLRLWLRSDTFKNTSGG